MKYLVVYTSATIRETVTCAAGLFDVTEHGDGAGSLGRQETAFRYAVERVNLDRELLPR